MMNIAVIGAGSWGSALAHLLACNGHEVCLYARRHDVCVSINREHRNCRYLSDSTLSSRVRASHSVSDAVKDVDAVVVVTPSAVLRDAAHMLDGLIGTDTPVVICSKGVESQTGLLPFEIFSEVLGNTDRLAALVGPNHAEEVIKGIASGSVVASTNPATARFFQHLFFSRDFRVYESADIIGAEVCAAFKNVIAIAVGLSYGIGLGDNTSALIITRGIAEMSRLVCACNGEERTCMGLAGIGDMVATCNSEHSRNRSFGYNFALGESLDDYSKRTHMVVEGALAARTISDLAQRVHVTLPICDMVRSVIWEGIDPRHAALSLLDRSLKPEFYTD